MNILFVPIGEKHRASSRLRVWNILPIIEQLGHACKVVTYIRSIGTGYSGIVQRKVDTKRRAERQIIEELDWFDVIVLQEVTLSHKLIKKIRDKNKKIIFDYSDPIHELHLNPNSSAIERSYHRLFSYPRFLSTISNADLITVENERVAEYSRQFAPTKLLRGPIDCEQFKPNKKLSDQRIIGWTGSPSTRVFIEPLIEILDELALQYDFKLVLFGANAEGLNVNNLEIESHKWTEEQEKVLIPTFDLGLFNLREMPTELSRGGGKLFVYMASGVCFVGPNRGISKEVHKESKTGYLFETKREFRQIIVDYLECNIQIDVEAKKSRQFADKKYSLEYARKFWIENLQEL